MVDINPTISTIISNSTGSSSMTSMLLWPSCICLLCLWKPLSLIFLVLFLFFLLICSASCKLWLCDAEPLYLFNRRTHSTFVFSFSFGNWDFLLWRISPLIYHFVTEGILIVCSQVFHLSHRKSVFSSLDSRTVPSHIKSNKMFGTL